jgi:hypothetical protein
MGGHWGAKVTCIGVSIALATQELDPYQAHRALHYHNEMPVDYSERALTQTVMVATTSSSTATWSFAVGPFGET